MEQFGPIYETNIVLGMLRSKVAGGLELSLAETLMAYNELAKSRGQLYGPTPATMKVKPTPLPEEVRGVLTNYTGV